MGHKAQITVQVVLEDAIFVARYRASTLESESLAFRNDSKIKPATVERDLKLRGEILANVVRILQERRQAIELDLKKTKGG